MKISLLAILLILLSSCSNSVKMIEPKKEEQLSLRDKRILYYQQLRKAQWNKIKKVKPTVVRIKPRRQKQRQRINLVNIQEQQIEIEQNMSYYCMEERKNTKLFMKGSCKEFTRNIYSDCVRKFDKGDARLTTCVKSRLKN
jgi:hypothetical protein